MGEMASQVTSLTIVYSTVYSGADQRKHQCSASLAVVQGIHRWPVNSLHIGQQLVKCFHLMTSSCNMINIPRKMLMAHVLQCLVDFTHILLGYLTGIWDIIRMPNACETALKNMYGWNIQAINNYAGYNHSKTKHNKTVCMFYGVYCKLCLLRFVHSIPFAFSPRSIHPRDAGIAHVMICQYSALGLCAKSRY